MKKISVACGMLLLTTTAMGCADDGDDLAWRKSVPAETGDTAGAQTTINGHVSTEGNGSAALGMAGKDALATADNVTVSQLGDNGQLTEVGKAEVNADGTFKVPVKSDSAAGVLIVQVKAVTGAVVGSAVINGIPAFFKGFIIDATVDTATSFKTEVLMTMSRKGVPGVQNYLNVLNAFVDAYLSGGIAVVGAFASDFNSIFGAVAESVVAAETVIGESLKAAGIPIDVEAITKSQVAAISGIQGLVTTANAKLVSNAKNLIASLQEATAKSVLPVDKAIFNAVIAGSAMFNSKFKSLMPQLTGGGFEDQGAQSQLSFGVLKSMFKLQGDIARDGIADIFGNAGSNGDALALVKRAGESFALQIGQATDVKALTDAREAFKVALLGKQENNGGGSVLSLLATVVNNIKGALQGVTSVIEPLTSNLANVLNAPKLTGGGINDALAEFDKGSKDLASKLTGVTSGKDAEAMAEAIKMAAKVFGQ